jgi:hypothetical protein
MTQIARSRSRIWIQKSEAWIRGSGSTPKCHGYATLVKVKQILRLADLFLHLSLVIVIIEVKVNIIKFVVTF